MLEAYFRNDKYKTELPCLTKDNTIVSSFIYYIQPVKTFENRNTLLASSSSDVFLQYFRMKPKSVNTKSCYMYIRWNSKRKRNVNLPWIDC